MKKITTFLFLIIAILSASAVTVTKVDSKESAFKYDLAKNFYPIALSQATIGNMEIASRISQDIRVDAASYGDPANMNISYLHTGYNSSWLNDTDGYYWNATVANGVTWSGMRYHVNNVDLSGITNDFVFHFAVRTTATSSFYFYLTDASDKRFDIVLGTSNFEDETSVSPLTDFPRDGEWYVIEIPVKDIMATGLSFTSAFTADIFTLKAGNVAGTSIDYDAVFFYEIDETTGVSDVTTTNDLKVVTSQGGINVTSSIEGIEVYNIQGIKVASSNTTTLNECLASGIYVVVNGTQRQKVIVE